MTWKSTATRGRLLAIALAGALAAALMAVGPPANATHTVVTDAEGLAYNYYVDVGLFGGPPTLKGYGQQPPGFPWAPVTPESESPSAECPEGGGIDTDHDPDGASARYGPAVIFGGIWPLDAGSAPPSGPMTSTVDCQLGPDGYVTASTSVTLAEDASYPGGIGPGPLIADEVHTSCTMTAQGVTSEVEFVNGIVETSYDPNTQLPATSEPIPDNPEPGYTVEGTIDHVGDSYRIVFNEQIENPDGSFTVNAAHMYLLGPTAVGDMVVGSSTCGPLTTVDQPQTRDDCKRGGWADFGYRNQGQCIQYVNTGDHALPR